MLQKEIRQIIFKKEIFTITTYFCVHNESDLNIQTSISNDV